MSKQYGFEEKHYGFEEFEGFESFEDIPEGFEDFSAVKTTDVVSEEWGINLSSALRSVGLIETDNNIQLLESALESYDTLEEALESVILDVEMQVENIMTSADSSAFERK